MQTMRWSRKLPGFNPDEQWKDPTIRDATPMQDSALGPKLNLLFERTEHIALDLDSPNQRAWHFYWCIPKRIYGRLAFDRERRERRYCGHKDPFCMRRVHQRWEYKKWAAPGVGSLTGRCAPVPRFSCSTNIWNAASCHLLSLGRFPKLYSGCMDDSLSLL